MFHTRIAPSPTGEMHIGTARTAYVNWLAARASGGRFFLRIDDTDAARNIPDVTPRIVETLNWLGLDWDAVVFQSHRLSLYREKAEELIKRGLARSIEGGAIVLVLGSGYPKRWQDTITGEVSISEEDLGETAALPLIRTNGTATYNWASVIDDWTLGINWIIRGVDHFKNTSKQVILWHLLGAPIPRLTHIGLIAYKGQKLSKRDSAASMLYYRDAGYDPDAMLNFLIRMGWGPKVDDRATKILSKARMLELFLGGNLRNSPANLDLRQLEAFDRKYKAQKGIWRNKDRLISVK